MSAPMKVDLWPSDIEVSDLVSPASILREQATLLGMKTKNLVTGKVELASDSAEKKFKYVFYLVAPALKNYRYRLLSIEYPVDLYPVTIRFESKRPKVEDNLDEESSHLSAKDYDDFIAKLGKVFSDERTKRVIRALISHSRE